MINNKRISELSSLTSASIHSNDLLLVSDVTDKESKQIDVDNFGKYLADNYKTQESYYADFSDQSEYAVKACSADSCKFATSASALTKQYYNISVKNSESSSYASVAKYAYGVFDPNNGSVNESLSSSWSRYAVTASYVENIPVLPSFINTSSYSFTSNSSSFSTKAKNSDSSSYSQKSSNSDYATQANSANSCIIAATSSIAYTASYIANPIVTSFNWISPVVVMDQTTDSINDVWTTISLTGTCPAGTWAAIANITTIETNSVCGQDNSIYVYLRKSSLIGENAEYQLFKLGSEGGNSYGFWIPVSSTNTFDVKLWQHLTHWKTTITIVGYLKNG